MYIYILIGEKVLHGNPSGVDNTCSTFGGALVFRKGRAPKFLPSLPELPIIITNTRYVYYDMLNRDI